MFAETLALAKRVASGEWIQGGEGEYPAPSGVGTLVPGLLRSLAQNNLGWALGLMNPLIGWADDLENDAASAFAFANSWRRSAADLQGVSEVYQRRTLDMSGMSGQTISAYQVHAGQLAESMRIQSEAMTAVADAVETAARLVQNVHGAVQDVIAEIAADTVNAHTMSVVSGNNVGGAVSPAVAARVSMNVAEATARTGPMVVGVVSTLAFLGPLLRGLIEGLKALGRWLGKQGTKAPKGPPAKPQKPAKPDTKKDKTDTKKPQYSADRFDKKVDGLKDDARFTKKTTSSGRETRQYERSGGFEQAKTDFDELTKGLEIKVTDKGGRYATLPDGRTVNVRDFSSGGSPTLEILDKSVSPNLITKFRYM